MGKRLFINWYTKDKIASEMQSEYEEYANDVDSISLLSRSLCVSVCFFFCHCIDIYVSSVNGVPVDM